MMTMPKEFCFSYAERRKFFHLNTTHQLPVYLGELGVLSYITVKAKPMGAELS